MAAPADRMKTGDLEPALTLVLTRDGRAIDLTDADSVSFRMKESAAAEGVSLTGTILDALDGEVAHVWAPGETDTAGTYAVEAVVTWSTGRAQTFPEEGTLTLILEPAIPVA